MAYSAIMYRVKPGHEEEIAKIFAGFQRTDSPIIRDANGEQVGQLLGTAVFIKDDVVVRFIHHEGSLADVGRHMARQQGVHLVEEELAPYLAEERDTTSPQAFAAYFRDATMRCISYLTLDTHPAAS